MRGAIGIRAWLVAAVLAAFACAPAAAGAAGRCGSHPWCDTSLGADARAKLLLNALTDQERIGLLAGDEPFGVAGGAHSHTGTGNGVARVGLPTTYYSDGPVGPRQGQTTALPIPLALAATFSPGMAAGHGGVVANEARSKGNDVIFAPTVNILRTPLNGRTFESYGEDPYLMSRLGVGWVEAAQDQGLIASVKHYAVNNQEGYDPSGSTGGPGAPLGAGAVGSRYLVNANVDERTLREIYLPHFEAAVNEANAGSIMCSYNKINGPYACEHRRLQEQILRQEWGFRGYVLADYGGAHRADESLPNGLDFEPWPGAAYGPVQVNAALAGGVATQAQVNEHVRRILRTLFAYGFFDRAAYRDDDAQIDKPAHQRTAQAIEEQAITLLENRGGVLPLAPKRLQTVALIGAGADSFTTGGGSGKVTPFRVVTPRAAIAKRLGEGVELRYEDGEDHDAAVAAATGADVAIVIPVDYQTEGADRRCLTLQCPDVHGDQDGLIEKVAAANPKTVVVLETGGPVLTPWREKVEGLLEAWYPGQEGGTAIARVLFGDADPGGRLPATFPKREADLPTAGDPEKYPGVNNEVHHKEGVLVGYRWFDAKGIEPAYPFGFGRSYTSFAYRALRVRGLGSGATVSVEVRNTGRRRGTDVAQLYLGMPRPSASVVQPPKQLRGFRRVTLDPGQKARVTFALDSRALSYWDTLAKRWRVAPGCYRVMVGRSSRNIVAQGTLAVGGASCPGGGSNVPGGGPACVRKRSLKVRIKGVRRSRVRKVTVYVNAKRRRVLRGPRAAVRVKLRRHGVTRVKLVIITRKHVRLVMRERALACG